MKARYATVTDLPNELILEILQYEEVTDKDLLSLAKASRRLNILAVQIFLTAHKMQDGEMTVNFGYHNHEASFIASFFKVAVEKPRLKHLQFCAFLNRLPIATRQGPIALTVLSNLSSVEKMTISFENTETPIRALLEMAATKSCRVFSIVHDRDRTLAPKQPNPAPFHAPSRKRKASIFSLWVQEPPTGIPDLLRLQIQSLALHALRGAVFSKPIPMPSAPYTNSVKPETLTTLRCAFPTHPWLFASHTLYFPNLLHFTLWNPNPVISDVHRFLLRHPTLRSLEYRSLQDYSRMTPPPIGMLPQLSILSGNPGDAAHFLCPRGALKALDTIRIFEGVECLYVAEAAEPFRNIFSLLSMRTEPLTLSFVFIGTSTLKKVFKLKPNEKRIEENLGCIEHLEITAESAFTGLLEDAHVAALPRWLAVFPALKEVVLTHAFMKFTEGELKTSLIKRIMRKCPRLKRLVVDDRVVVPQAEE